MMDDLPQRLTARLRQPLPGRIAHERFAPELSFGRHQGPPPANARLAAVVLLLYPRDNAWHLPLTVRQAALTAHAGQISLPGGVVDPPESSSAAALRELSEELGVPGTGMEQLGPLSPLYLYGSNYLIQPWVMAVRETPRLVPNPQEVATLLEIPLEALLDSRNIGQHTVTRAGITASTPHLAWGEFHIWGATAMIVSELLQLIRDVDG